MSNTFEACPIHANADRRVVAMPHRTHGRTRTASLISTSSGRSFRSAFELSRAYSPVTASECSSNQAAAGSFIPIGSATASLQNIASCYSPSPRRRRVTFLDKTISYPASDESDDGNDGIAGPSMPYIMHTQLPATIPYPPSPASSTSSTSLPHDRESDSQLHPILASLERKSKLCSRRVYCSSCKKPGTDYPRCGKCGEMWCSRDCRLLGGKRHICSSH
ncbi:hypothetical protein BDQ12DRAFT_457197 [Crucibulum laeve]|uniref:HIT-type domain-containing protein n=1 Tax=Crucibulum laeve TaxID=68775 RepID=A0A5C3M805_9AGAR|nr:hypothetical protein BDQ12DRAFT_457197 [Crucibulum laeve]